LREQQPALIFIDILSPDVTKPLMETILSFAEKDLRKLGAFMSQLDVFICADTGPMHLACASGVATIALFRETSPQLYGPLGKNDLSLVMKDKTVAEISGEILQHIQKNT